MIEDYYLIVLQSSLQLQIKNPRTKQMECGNLWHLNVVGGHDKQICQLIGGKCFKIYRFTDFAST